MQVSWVMLRGYLSSEIICRNPESKQILGRLRVRVSEQWKHVTKWVSATQSGAVIGACEGSGHTTMQYLPPSGTR